MNCRWAGFTLAELLLTVALLAIATGIGLVFKQRADDADRYIQSLVISADGSQVVGAFNDGSMRIWRTADGKPLHSFAPQEEFFYHPALSADFRFVARPRFLGEKTFAIEISDLESGKEVRRIEHDGAFTMALSSDGSRLALADSAIQNVRLIDVDDPGAASVTLVDDAHGTSTHGVTRLLRFSSDDRYLGGVTNDRLVRWNLDEKKLETSAWNYSGHIYDFSPMCIAFSQDGNRAAIAGIQSRRNFVGLGEGRPMWPYVHIPQLLYPGSTMGFNVPDFYRGIAFVEEENCLVGLSDAGLDYLDYLDPQHGKRRNCLRRWPGRRTAGDCRFGFHLCL
jgi:hypothetical protein